MKYYIKKFNRMNNKIDLTVIIPIYNVEEYLSECIDSLMHQGNLRLEIILVNDGSTDSSGAIADQYANIDSRIKIIHKENGGASTARNVGLELAQGEYIAFLDSDDWVSKNSLSELYCAAVKYGVDIALGNLMYFYKDKIIAGFYKPVPKETQNIVFSGKEGFIRWSETHSFRPMACNYIYRRRFLEKIRAQFEEGIMCEDELWTPIVFCHAQKIIAVDIDFYFYRQRKGSVMHSSSLKKHLDAYFTVTDKLMKFADRFAFSGEDGEFKNWWYVNIFWLYFCAFNLLPKIKDSSYVLPPHHLERFWRDCWEMMPCPQKICKNYYRDAETGLKRYTDWRTSEWVASIAFQMNKGKRFMLIHNVIRGEKLSLEDEVVPDDWLITTDRRYFQQADVVVFYIPDLIQELENDLEKPEGQIWVAWQLAETEKNYPWINYPEFKELFDLQVYYPEDESQKEHPVIQLCRTITHSINIS